MAENLLYYGGNLDIVRRYISDESVDLIYLDPPFNSKATYNVLFREQDGSQAAAQIKAFEDTWHWDRAAVAAYQEVVERSGQVSQALQAFHGLVGGNDVMAYLTMMAPRLVELQRVLKPTGSIYLHCDPTASHYLKVLMDAIFGPRNFRNEIIWRRTGAHGKSRRFGPIHDIILLYSKSDDYRWYFPKHSYMKGPVEEYFIEDEQGWRTNYYGNVLTGSGLRRGESGQPWKGFDPSAKGRHWQIPRVIAAEIEDEEGFPEMTQHEKLDRLLELGYVKITPGQAWPIYEHYLKPDDGQAISDIWAYQPYTEGTVFGTNEGIDAEVRWLSPRDQERLGYPTQKPEALLERIVRASSREGDTVLDPFCGCGTTVAAAQKLNRRWIGIDITNLAITLIRHRLQDAYGPQIAKQYRVIGEPVSVPDAVALAQQDRYQFQWWALGLVGARPTPIDQKKGADKGIDGRLYFFDDPQTGNAKLIVFSVKSGHLKATDVRDLRGVIDREKAAIGVLIALEEPTRQMRAEAASAGNYESPFARHKVPRLQILTVEHLLSGRGIEMTPNENIAPFGKKAPRARARQQSHPPLPFGEEANEEQS